MLVYTDIFTNDEVISDSYKQVTPFSDDALAKVAFEVESRRIVKRDEDFGISANVDEDAAEGTLGEAGGDAVTVIDVIDGFHLEEYRMSKNDFKAYIKGYMGHLIKHLEEKKPDRLAAFKTGIAGLVKKVLEEWESAQIYMGESYADYAPDNKAMPIISYYKGEETAPRFIFMTDGLLEVKC